MWLSTRTIRRVGDQEWKDYIDLLGLLDLREVRSIDSWCNPHVNYSQDFSVSSLDQVWEMLNWLPSPNCGQQYYLLFADAAVAKIPQNHPSFKWLGYDLSNQTKRSSLLNYKPWTGILAPFSFKVNEYGLLSRWEDVLAAQNILPQAWYNDPYSYVKIWTLFEVLPPP